MKGGEKEERRRRKYEGRRRKGFEEEGSGMRGLRREGDIKKETKKGRKEGKKGSERRTFENHVEMLKEDKGKDHIDNLLKVIKNIEENTTSSSIVDTTVFGVTIFFSGR